MRMMASAMAASSGLVVMSRTNAMSIFSVSIGKRRRYDRLEYPVPKSSTEIRTPWAFSSCRVEMVRSVFAISELSVSSSSSRSAGTSWSRSALSTSPLRSPSMNCRPETFTDTGTGPTGDRSHTRDLPAGRVDHPAPDVDDEPGLLEHRDELARRDEAVARPLPAQQGLDATTRPLLSCTFGW